MPDALDSPTHPPGPAAIWLRRLARAIVSGRVVTQLPAHLRRAFGSAAPSGTEWQSAGDILTGRCVLPLGVYAPGDPRGILIIAALVDTGAMRSAISQPIATMLGLPQTGRSVVASPAMGLVTMPTYRATIEALAQTCDRAAWPLGDVEIDGLVSPMGGIHFLIGMDIISRGRLEVRDGIWRLSFPGPPLR
jgi:predicted aspartyl protease